MGIATLAVVGAGAGDRERARVRAAMRTILAAGCYPGRVQLVNLLPGISRRAILKHRQSLLASGEVAVPDGVSHRGYAERAARPMTNAERAAAADRPLPGEARRKAAERLRAGTLPTLPVVNRWFSVGQLGPRAAMKILEATRAQFTHVGGPDSFYAEVARRAAEAWGPGGAA